MGYLRTGMMDLLKLFAGWLVGLFRSHAAREAEVAFLRQQLLILKRSAPARLRLPAADRLIFVWLYRLFPSVRNAAVIFKPATLGRWHRSGFCLYWRWKSRRRAGRPMVPADIRALIRTISRENLLWGAPRIHGELLKLGIDIAQSTVANYMLRRRGPPSPGWRAFLRNHTVPHRRHRHLLLKYSAYYNSARTHLALDKDALLHRPIQTVGRIASVAWLGSLHRQVHSDGINGRHSCRKRQSEGASRGLICGKSSTRSATWPVAVVVGGCCRSISVPGRRCIGGSGGSCGCCCSAPSGCSDRRERADVAIRCELAICLVVHRDVAGDFRKWLVVPIPNYYGRGLTVSAFDFSHCSRKMQ